MIKKIIICKIKHRPHRQDSGIPRLQKKTIFKFFSQRPKNPGKYDLNKHGVKRYQESCRANPAALTAHQAPSEEALPEILHLTLHPKTEDQFLKP